MAITFDKPDRVILITSPQTEVDIQSLVNAIRDYEDELDQLDIPKIANASGKEDLGGGTFVGITLELVNDWRVQFEDRAGPTTEIMLVLGGNLVATNIYNNNPIKASTFTQVQVARSSSGTINQLEITNLLYRIESLRTTHPKAGDTIYWNPVTGDDGFDGQKPTTGTLTFAAAHALATDGQGDVIQCVTTGTAGTVMVDEQLVITKSISVRGPGDDFVLQHTTGAGATVTIQADNVGFEDMVIEHVGGNPTEGVLVDGSVGAENCFISGIKIRNTNGSAIVINNSGNSVIEDCFIEDCGDDGINIGNNTDDLVIRRVIIDRPSDHGIHLSGTSVLDTIISNCEIHDATNYGIFVGAGTNQTIIRADNLLFDNGLGDIFEEVGSQNVTIEKDKLDEPIEQIQFSVESLREHHTSFGKTVYWDPVNGSDFNNNLGNIPSKATRSFRKAQSLLANIPNSVVAVIPSNTSGDSIITEEISITQRTLFLRGTGRAITFRPASDTGLLPHGTVTGGPFEEGETITQAVSGATGLVQCVFDTDNELHLESVTGTFDNTNTITGGTSGATAVPSSALVQGNTIINITGETVQVKSVRLSPSRSGMDGILVDGSGGATEGNFADIKEVWADNVDTAISVNDSENTIIENCVIRNTNQDSIVVGNNTASMIIEKNIINGSTLSGVVLSGTGITDVNFIDNQIASNTIYGIDIGSGATDTTIRGDNFVFGNGTTNVRDNGVSTVFEDKNEENNSYQGAVHIHLNLGSSGTEFPVGTPSNPVDNITDAKTIADNIGVSTYEISGGSITLNASHPEWTFIGKTRDAGVNINNQDVSDSRFIDIILSGQANGEIEAAGCNLANGVSGLNGLFDRCAFIGTLSTANASATTFFECYSAVPGTTKPIIDFGVGLSGDSNIRAYCGGLEIRNVDQASQDLTIDLLSGNVLIDSSCTDGNIVVRGVGDLVDNSNGTTVNTQGSAFGLSIGRFQSGAVFIDTTNGSSGTTFPIGTPTNPVDNITDAKAIADANGLSRYHIVGGSTISLVSAHTGWVFEGTSFSDDTVNTNGQNIDNSRFSNINLTGSMSGRISVDNCTVEDVTSLDGTITNSSLVGTITLASLANVFGFNNHAGGSTGLTLNVNGAGRIFAMANVTGSWAVQNVQSGIPFDSVVSLSFVSGDITIENTNTGGSIGIVGSVGVTDNSAGATVNISEVISKAAIADTVWDEAIADHQNSGSMGEYMRKKVLSVSKFLGLK